MEVLSNQFYESFKRYWKRRRYQRLNGAITNRKYVKIARFGGSPARRLWKIKPITKLRWKIASPLKLFTKLKNAYINMMLNLAGNGGYLNNGNVFGGKRIPKARQQGPVVHSSIEFENRLIFEIYLSLMASRELAAI